MNASVKQDALELVEQEHRAAGPVAVMQDQARALAVPEQSPAALMLQALKQGADLAQVEKMLDLQERWEANEARKAYNEDFAKFKMEAITIVRGRKVTDGPLSGRRYAELHAFVDALTPALSKHGFSASWRISRDEPSWIEVTCTLKHRLGHSESVSMGGPPDAGGAKNAIQARASTVSYLERYTLKAICGVAEQGQDDDGQGGATAGDDLLDAGRAAALEGSKKLTEWWASLTPKDRGRLSKEFTKMRQAARAADEEVGRV